MRRFMFLVIFVTVTVVNAVLLVAFRKVNSAGDLTFTQKTLDFSGAFDVRIDIDFLKRNLSPAYE